MIYNTIDEYLCVRLFYDDIAFKMMDKDGFAILYVFFLCIYT